jgi:hypothetical protein
LVTTWALNPVELIEVPGQILSFNGVHHSISVGNFTDIENNVISDWIVSNASESDIPAVNHWKLVDLDNTDEVGITQVQHADRGLPLLLLGASTDVNIVWSTPFEDDSYTVLPAVATSLVGGASTSVTSQDEDGCTVRVTAGAVIAAGTVLTVVAYK